MSTSTAIAIRDDQTTFDDLQTRALAHIGVETANPADLAVFFHTCKRTGLDPFARQIYMIRRDGKQTMQTGIDGLRLVAQRTAERTRERFGYEDTLWADSTGVWHDVWLSTEAPAAAKVTVLRNGQRFPSVALFHEYVQRKRDGVITKMWQDKAALMLAKCAEAQALRKAFPQDLSGIYTPDEVREQHEPGPSAAPRGLDAVRAAVGAPVEQPAEGEPVEATLEPDETGEALTDHTRKTMHALFRDLGLTTKAAQMPGIIDVIGRHIESRTELTEAEGVKVNDALRTLKRQNDMAAVQAGEA